jgi:small subunit ribosomal protein S11
MGKKRVIKKGGEGVTGEGEAKIQEVKIATKIARGVAHIQATYNNTLITISDDKGNTLAASSAGSLGFNGAKKATPFAAARVIEALSEKLKKVAFDEMHVFVKGVGSGRDSAVRSLVNRGYNITSIKDITPTPHNGPRPKKPRRV